MKLQYRYYGCIGYQYMIRLYCDGYLVKSYKVYLDELDNEIDKIERQGYIRGYTEEEAKKAKEEYERMLSNIIVKDIND